MRQKAIASASLASGRCKGVKSRQPLLRGAARLGPTCAVSGQAQGLARLPRRQAACPSKSSPVLSGERKSQPLIKDSMLFLSSGWLYFPELLLNEFSSCLNSGGFPSALSGLLSLDPGFRQWFAGVMDSHVKFRGVK